MPSKSELVNTSTLIARVLAIVSRYFGLGLRLPFSYARIYDSLAPTNFSSYSCVKFLSYLILLIFSPTVITTSRKAVSKIEWYKYSMPYIKEKIKKKMYKCFGIETNIRKRGKQNEQKHYYNVADIVAMLSIRMRKPYKTVQKN